MESIRCPSRQNIGNIENGPDATSGTICAVDRRRKAIEANARRSTQD